MKCIQYNIIISSHMIALMNFRKDELPFLSQSTNDENLIDVMDVLFFFFCFSELF